MHGYS